MNPTAIGQCIGRGPDGRRCHSLVQIGTGLCARCQTAATAAKEGKK